MKVEWTRLAENLYARRLLPTLGPRIQEFASGHTNGFPIKVHKAIEACRRQSAFLQLVASRLIAALADEGIRSTILKGPQLGETIYGDPGRRLSNDIDLLVAPEQLEAAATIVQQFGYRPPSDHVRQDGLPQLHFTLNHRRGELPPIELHWRVHWYERIFSRERLLSPTVDASGAWRPAPADELAALLLFYARDGFIDLRLATDISAWWDIFGKGLPLGALDQVIRAYPPLARPLYRWRPESQNVQSAYPRLTSSQTCLACASVVLSRCA